MNAKKFEEPASPKDKIPKKLINFKDFYQYKSSRNKKPNSLKLSVILVAHQASFIETCIIHSTLS